MTKKILAVLAVCVGIVVGGYTLLNFRSMGQAHAQVVTVDAGVPAIDAGLVAPAPSHAIDPTEHPTDFVGSLSDAKKKGWLALVLVGLLGLLKLIQKAGTNVSWLAWLGKGRAMMIIAGAGTVLAGCVDAVFVGGTLVSVGMGAVWAIVGLMSPAAKAS